MWIMSKSTFLLAKRVARNPVDAKPKQHNAQMKAKSIEEKIEDLAKKQLDKYCVRHFAKTESINSEIDESLSKAESKTGGKGGNRPDIKVLLKMPDGKQLPVMIEVKGKKGDLEKLDKNGNVENRNEKGERIWKNISSKALNGAVHYSEAIINYSHSYKNVIAIGINGYFMHDNDENPIMEYAVYYVSQENMLIAKRIGDYSDLSFLAEKNLNNLQQRIFDINISEEEQERRAFEFENIIETTLQDLNQNMHDNLNIRAESRVQLVCGMIMAALGVEGKVSPLEITDLKGDMGANNNDGKVMLNKIYDFLENKKLPKEKLSTIQSIYEQILIDENYYTPKNGESPIKAVYMVIKDDIMPIFLSGRHLDFTGRLFNVLNSWIPLRPGDDKNDVVLTPRYVTELMARLCQVDRNSYVWDYAAGSGGFLISAMKLMIEDVKANIHSEDEKRTKIDTIKLYQLLGVEIRPEIYILAVLNMILMGDGSSHILNSDSLKYDGTYMQSVSDEGDKNFPANVFLLNPPYSAEGKGFVFVDRALGRMKTGRAAILIQENAGSGNGLPFTKRILEHNSLLASIKMPDKLFIGKASVQTAIYLFEVGKPHNPKKEVVFIDFTEDGYSRQNRKKSGLNVNLRDTGNAKQRYQELCDIICGNKRLTNFFDDKILHDTITLEGDDWTYGQHQKIETIPTETDFRKTVTDYLSWKIMSLIKSGQGLRPIIEQGLFDDFSQPEIEAMKKMKDGLVKWKEIKIGDLFDIHPTNAYKLTNSNLFHEGGKYPVVTNSSVNNGVTGYSNLAPTEKGNIITYSDTTTSEGIFYQPDDFIGYPHVQGLYPKQNSEKWNEKTLLCFVSLFRKSAGGRFDYATKFNRAIASKMLVSLPITASGEIDWEFMQNLITAENRLAIRGVIETIEK